MKSHQMITLTEGLETQTNDVLNFNHHTFLYEDFLPDPKEMVESGESSIRALQCIHCTTGQSKDWLGV